MARLVMLAQIRKLESKGENVHRYTPEVGGWMWQQKVKWSKKTVEEQQECKGLACFEEMFGLSADHVKAEWTRMFNLCVEFEQKNPTLPTIAGRQTYKGNPIGQWLTAVKRRMTDWLGSSSQRRKPDAELQKAKKLRSVQYWFLIRKPSWSENFNAQMESMFEDIKHRRGYFSTPSASASSSSLWSVLELQDNASMEVAKASYKALAVKHHPDKGGDPKKFIAVKEAYDKLAAQNGWS